MTLLQPSHHEKSQWVTRNKTSDYNSNMLFGLVLILSLCVFVRSQQQYVVNFGRYKSNKHFRNTGQEINCLEPPITDITDEESTLALTFLAGMTESEKVLLMRKFRNASYYFEYGCGGSTLLACKIANENFKMVSVDSSKEWLDKVQNDSCFTPENSNRLQLHHVDLGKVAGFGYPINGSTVSKWHSYGGIIAQYEPESIDLVLVDGRFRVASALQALLSVKPGVEVIFHDFFIRKQYFSVLKFAEIVDCQDTLAVLRRKEGLRDEEIKEEIENFVRNPF